MDVHLLVYDLSGGIARQMSAGLLGFQLDAVYHTSIELEGMEYVYDSGINVIRPGTSHLGPPLQRIYLGKTELPMEVIIEYLDSLREIYTPEAYDLFRHNCNNFSNDFSMFLLGKGIPKHISNMPQAVLDSPFGRMLEPQLKQMVEQRKAQQGGLLGIQNNVQPRTNVTAAAAAAIAPPSQGTAVRHVTSLPELETALEGKPAIVFFTMAGCGPCRMLYPLYDRLSAQHGDRITFIMVDIRQASDVARTHSITATPTFMTFLHGEQSERWMGADPRRLETSIDNLALEALNGKSTYHQHKSFGLPHFEVSKSKPVLYTKIPPLPKLLSKLGPKAETPSIQGVKHFIETRSAEGPAEVTLPDMLAFSNFLCSAVADLPKEVLFAVVDLFRCALIDPRFSSYFAEEHGHKTFITLLDAVNKDASCPYALRLVTLHMACNLFSSHLCADQVLGQAPLRTSITELISSSFLDDSHNNVRVAAASLLFNIGTANYQKREKGEDPLPESDQIELAASVLEAISQEESSGEALRAMLMGLGSLAYCMPLKGELVDLLRSMDAHGTVLAKKARFPDEPLIAEIGSLLPK